jgi:uncharacterized protein (DUF362 family)
VREENIMDRRTFIRRAAGLSALAGSYAAFGPHGKMLALPLGEVPTAPYDLVAVRGGGPAEMFDKGMEAYGGLGQFVKKGHTVVIKPNIGWDVSPERGANTNPQLVARIIQRCYDVGARRVFVVDHTCDDWRGCYQNSGIESAAKEAGATVASGSSEGSYHPVTVKNGKNLKTAKVHELILESDVFINVPILKSHSSARLTVAMKNMMGVVWDRGFWHANDLHQCIADFASYAKPTLNVIDAYGVMKRNGPRGVSVNDVVTMKSLLISLNMVTADAAAAKLLGMEPRDVPYIRVAADNGVGRTDLEKLMIKRIVM